jgi:hypothetical protein
MYSNWRGMRKRGKNLSITSKLLATSGNHRRTPTTNTMKGMMT